MGRRNVTDRLRTWLTTLVGEEATELLVTRMALTEKDGVVIGCLPDVREQYLSSKIAKG